MQIIEEQNILQELFERFILFEENKHHTMKTAIDFISIGFNYYSY